MRLSYVQVVGFRGFRELTRVEIPPGFAIIVGSNGSGKSTVCDAIEFALTGNIRGSSDHREKGESIHDYLWWRGPRPPAENYVEIGLTNAQGATVVVRRSPTELTVTPSARLEDLLVTGGPALENPLGQLCRTAILRDEEITRLSVDLRETERFEFVRSALGTADFRTADESAKRVGDLLKRHHETARRDYELQRDRIAQLTTRMSQARTQAARAGGLAEAEATLKEGLEEPIGNGVELLAKSQRAVATQRQRVDGLKRGYARLTDIAGRLTQLSTPQHLAAIDGLEEKLRAADAAATEANRESETVQEELSKFQAASPRNLSLAQLLEHGRRLGLDDGDCPLCGVAQTDEHFKSHLETLDATLAAADATLASLSRNSADTAQRALEATRVVDSLRSELTRLRGSEVSTRAEFSVLCGELEPLGFRCAGAPAQGLQELASLIETLQLTVAKTESALAVIAASQAASQILELERESAAARERLVAAEKTLSDVARAQGQVKDAAQTIKRVQGELVDEQLAALSPLLVELYERLRPHVDWLKVRYNLRGDVRRMLSLEVGAGINPNFVFSSGQRRAAGLAFLIAIFLSRNWCKLRTLVLDDPVQHVDDYRALHLTEVLAAVRRAKHQIICTVEDRALAELLARRLRSDFDDQGAVIELAYTPGEGAGVAQVRSLAPLTRQVLVAG